VHRSRYARRHLIVKSVTNLEPTRQFDRNRALSVSVRYVSFAIIAGVMNLMTQAIVFSLLPVQPLAISILAGTAVGFIVKYLLDKHWIFFDNYDNVSRELNKVFLYASFSVAMTLVFWGFEIAFLAIGSTTFAKYLGAVIGLAIGNFAKYFLDRRFTFKQKAQSWK
jgi:putative flippase GtrA